MHEGSPQAFLGDKSAHERQPSLIHSILAEHEESRLLDLLDYLEQKIPAEYRKELLSFLLPRTLTGRQSETTHTAIPSAEPRHPPADQSRRAIDEEYPIRLESYRALIARRGETLLKAMATLLLAEAQIEVRWLTPREIVRLMSELDDDKKIYRSNVSNVLRNEATLVARRSRGRGFEYRLTKPGRARVLRELSLLEIEH